MRTGADQLTISQINQDLILKTIKKHNQITRAGIAQKLRLSPPSVSSNIEKLLQKGLVQEFATDASEGPGRKGKLIGLNEAYAYIVCADLSSPVLTMGLGTIKEEILECRQYDRLEGLNACQVLACVKNAVADLLARNHLTMDQVGSMVVCSPGIIDEYAGKIEYAPQFPGWGGANVFSALREEYGDRLILMNDANSIALGELQKGIGRYYDSFAYINIDVGIGGGIIVDHKLLQGHNLAAGELGFMLTALDQLGNPSPEKGSLERLISIHAIQERLAEQLSLSPEELTISVINQRYRSGDSVVRREIDTMIRMIAMCAVNISAILNVPVICLGGMIRELDVDLEQRISGLIQGMIPYAPHICRSQLGSTGFIYGALYLGADRILHRATHEVE